MDLRDLRAFLGLPEEKAGQNKDQQVTSRKQDLGAPKRVASTNAPIPQPEIQTSDNAFSTFSLNVSDVSFKLAAASLEKGELPDAAGIRSEEFINAFDYRDPEPREGVPIGFAWNARNIRLPKIAICSGSPSRRRRRGGRRAAAQHRAAAGQFGVDGAGGPSPHHS